MKNNEPGYKVKSVDISEPPKGMQAGEWHSYILVRGTTEITGVRFDTLKAVKIHARELAEKINARNGWTSV